jgi:hypothetical protein
MQNRQKLEDVFTGESGPTNSSPEKGLMYSTHNRADGSKEPKPEDPSAELVGLNSVNFIFNDQDVRPEK